MTQFFKFITDNWWGGFFLGAYLFGFALHAMYEKLFTKKVEPMKYITEWAAALFWFFPFFYRTITGILSHFNKKKATEVAGLILLPALTMAADNRFLDYQLLPAIGIAIGLAPFIWLYVLIKTAQGKYKHTYYDENGGKRVEFGVKRKITSFKAFRYYLIIHPICLAICIAILKHNQ